MVWMPSPVFSTEARYPSRSRILAMAYFTLEEGNSTNSRRTEMALRSRVSMSEIGSVIIGVLPAGLGHARDLAAVGELAEADAAEAEDAHEGAFAPATPAPVHDARRALRLPLRFGDLVFRGPSVRSFPQTACRACAGARGPRASTSRSC